MKLSLSDEAKMRIEKCRNYLDKKMETEQNPVYGINTGFGSLCKFKISSDEIEQLQYNLIVSHACGTGALVSDEIVRIMILLKIQSLSYGYSGVHLNTVLRLIDFYNLDILPVIYEQGSLGASGDLCPLAHMSLPLVGEGFLKQNGIIKESKEVLKHHQLDPLHLQSKEGLALLNGTQFMNAHAVYCMIKAQKIINLADLIAALSLEAWDCRHEPFLAQIHTLRNQEGQKKSAQNILNILDGSNTFFEAKEQVQDPYSFRCIPQVHGASRDAIEYCKSIFEKELNGVTDNPNVFVDDDLIISGGNFHGQPLALSLDFLAIALSEIGNISERRIYRMLSGARGLPEFLTELPGLHSGMMIPQYTAASIVSQNKQLCTPASVDSIASSNEQEDHVSMGANAATKCVRVTDNVMKILAIELMNAAQAFSIRKKTSNKQKKSSEQIEKLMHEYRSSVPFLEGDRILFHDISSSIRFLDHYL